VPGTPPPTSGMLLTNPYYEIMVAGNVWLPEDMLYGLAKHSDVDYYTGTVRHMGQWGNAAGTQLRAFLKEAGRPLIWADSDDSEMLIDPTVGNIAGGRITAADIAVWEALWVSLTDLTPLEQAYRLSAGGVRAAAPQIPLPLVGDEERLCAGGTGSVENGHGHRRQRRLRLLGCEPTRTMGVAQRRWLRGQRQSQSSVFEPRRLCPRSYPDEVGLLQAPRLRVGDSRRRCVLRTGRCWQPQQQEQL